MKQIYYHAMPFDNLNSILNEGVVFKNMEDYIHVQSIKNTIFKEVE